jgi:MaoC dehydratase-like protein
MPELAVRELRNAPSMLPMFAKALMRLNVKPGKNPQLPAIGARLSDVVLDPKHLAAYRKVCGFSDTGTLPITYPHMHAHPLFMTLLLDSRFPFPAIGLVHVGNRITQYRPIQAREQLDVECSFGALEKKDAGYEFTILTNVTTGGEHVWESESTMIFRTGGGSKKKSTPTPEPASNTVEWKIADNIGRRYGAVSGDRNPIHLYPLTAKLLGFKRQIAHGMWSKARCLAELESQLPTQAFSVDVQFKLPMFIPAKVKFAQTTVDNGIDFKLLGQDGVKPHLHGQVRTIDA